MEMASSAPAAKAKAKAKAKPSVKDASELAVVKSLTSSNGRLKAIRDLRNAAKESLKTMRKEYRKERSFAHCFHMP